MKDNIKHFEAAQLCLCTYKVNCNRITFIRNFTEVNYMVNVENVGYNTQALISAINMTGTNVHI